MLHDLSFGAPLWLWGLLALPALAGLFAWAERRASARLVRLIRDSRLRGQLTGAASAARRRWRYGLLLAALGCFLVTMAGPRLGYETLEVHRRGLDLVVIVDVSKSMLAQDLAPDRLTRAKLAVQDLLRQLPGDRVGLVAFAGNAFLQAPLTIDYDAVLNAAAELDTDLIPVGGTNLGGAIDLALQAFGKNGTGNRAILLLSDGEPTSDT
ncbi:MAG: VWA domain-containing protein, partial [Gluconacetobacter diazotrophicus]|nr:VWA domain-containing protein [Gluconacetobacter diazotrophicus]